MAMAITQGKRARRRMLVGTLLLCSVLLVAAGLFRGRLIALLKPLIERALSDASGYSISFESASLKVVPYLGVRLTGGRAISPHGCSSWSIGMVSAKVQLRPFLDRKIEVRRLDIDELHGQLGLQQGRAHLVNDAGEQCNGHPVGAPDTAAKLPPASLQADEAVSVLLDDIRVNSADLILHYDGEQHTIGLDKLQASLSAAPDKLNLPMLELTGQLDSVPFAIEANDVALLAGGRSLNVPGARLALGAQSLTLSGHYDLTLGSGKASVQAERLSLGALHPLLADLAPKMEGEMSLKLLAELSAGDVVITGDALLSGVSSVTTGALSLEHLSLGDLRVFTSKGEVLAASASLSLRGFHCKSDGDRYALAAANGDMRLTAGDRQKIEGSLHIQDFGFGDEDTTIDRVGATLRDISADLSPQGDVDVRLKLDARSIHLVNPNIEIFSVDSVGGPIRVSVPASGGYDVSGPITVAGGRMKAIGRELTQTGGTIDMSIASLLKSFVSRNLSTRIHDEPALAAANFAMTHSAYTLKDTQVSIAGGAIDVNLELGRHRKGPMSTIISVKGVSIPTVYKAIMSGAESPVHGRVLLGLKAQADSADLLHTVTGDGTFLVSGAVLRTIDLQGLLQAAIVAIPGIGSKVTPTKDPQQISDGNIAATLSLGSGKLNLSDLWVQYSNFTIRGGVQAGFDGSLSGLVSVIYLEDTFRMLGFGIKPLGDFLAREGRVAIPLKLSGSISKPSVSANMEAIEHFVTGRDLLDGVRSAFGANTTPAQSLKSVRALPPKVSGRE